MTMRAKRYQNFAALLIFMRRTTISHFSFLISHSGESFKCNQGGQYTPRANLEITEIIINFP